ncbi:MAG: citramalate synthase [Rhodothermales bacterium]|nr:citramalate synthase [Rhodothermales bacterium]MBO6779370.1 citramalate synthase [Rhodothermales bacterium]
MTSVEIFDTTLRDGTQGEHVSLSAADKIRIARRLDAAGIDIIEGGWPGSNPKDMEFFRRARDEAWSHARICAFGSTRRAQFAPEDDPNLQAMLAADTSVVSLFGKSWRLHATVALGVSLEENLELIRSSVAYLKACGRHVIYDAEHFFDGHADDPAYALETLAAAAEAGADVLVLCDTNGGTLPTTVQQVVTTVAGQFSQPIGIHSHNDGACAAANAIVAVQAGARHVQGTINGIGERCGNADLCSVIPGLQLKLGYDCLPGDALGALTELSHFVDDVANLDPVDRSPYVGRSAFAHKGGIHVSAVMKDPRAYEHIEPEHVGNRRRVLVSDLSGQSNVRYKAAEFGIELDDSTTARKAVARIKDLENLGYAFEGAEASFELLLRAARGETTDFFRLERVRVRTEMGGGPEHSEASAVVAVGNQREHVVAEGHGPVDAMSRALRKALMGLYPGLATVRLSDYKVRVLTPEDGTAASVRVLVEHSDGTSSWNTVGVSENIIEASWQALADGMTYSLLRSGVAVPIGATGATA